MWTVVVVAAATIAAISAQSRREREFDDQLEAFFNATTRSQNYAEVAFNVSPEDVARLTRPLEVPSPELTGDVYDFIIVGSGASGSALASRLSENPKWRVLLLEAGRVENLLTRVPSAAQILQATDYNWRYLMEYQPNFANGMEDNLMSWPKGKALGGGTVIDHMVYSRGHPADYEAWGVGNPGWGYHDVLPYFLKSERCRLRDVNRKKNHNTKGVLSIEDGYQPRLVHAFIEAGGELGFQKYVDYNSPEQIGFATTQGTLLRGVRHSAARAYLFPIIDRENLFVLTEAFVTKVLLDPVTKVAYGVEYYKDGEKRSAFVKKEVVLSAGTFHSPQLLMLSGVGPAQHLKGLGLDVIANLPVGETLIDHPVYMGLLFKTETPITYTTLELLNLLGRRFFKTYPGRYRSALASLAGVDGIAFIQTNVTSNNTDFPDAQLELISQTLGTTGGFLQRPLYRIRRELYETYWRPLADKPTFSIYPTVLHPKSRGHLKLRSADPFTGPLLYGNYFNDPHRDDMKTMIAAIRLVLRLAKTDTFKSYGIKLHDVPVPGCEWYKFHSDEYWECAIRTLTHTRSNHAGTCKMGPAYDLGAVVDHELRVHKVQGLRVADSSVLPVTLGAHMSAVAVMIGEKAADMIRSAWDGIPEF